MTNEERQIHQQRREINNQLGFNTLEAVPAWLIVAGIVVLIIILL